MATFPGGSAWAMAKDIAAGYIMLSDRSLIRFNKADLTRLTFELDRRLREIRGQQPPLEDLPEQKKRHRAILRLQGAVSLVQSFRRRRKI